MIKYKVYFSQPEQHYVDIELNFVSLEKNHNELYMPVWTPGSYMIREYSKNIVSLKLYKQANQEVKIDKISKNKWQFYSVESETYFVKYRIYCNEISVRTNHVDAAHALLNGAPTFITVKGQENIKHEVEIKPFDNWEKISTSLKPINSNPWHRFADNYDELVDSPIEIGNQEVITFTAGNIPHELAIIGKSNMPKTLVINDLIQIINKELELTRQVHPCENYVFILHHTDGIYGGLEHKNSSVNMVDRWNYSTREQYLQVISLLAHEYFHLWNVKRFRPVELGPFDYDTENYTKQLWSVEGINSYYDDYLVYLAGVSSKSEYLNIVSKNINTTINTPGDSLQSLTESSFDAWIKYYRRNENTHNTQVNYYVKGAAVSAALNLLILDKTDGKKSLDDVIRKLYQQYLDRPEQGYSEDEFLSFCEEIAGCDLKSFFKEHIYGTQAIDYSEYLSLAGLDLKDTSQKVDFDLGWTITDKSGRFIVEKINKNCSAAYAGINANDEILSFNGFRMEREWEKFLLNKNIGDTIEIILSRHGITKTISLKIMSNQKRQYKILEVDHPTAKQLKLRKAWLPID